MDDLCLVDNGASYTYTVEQTDQFFVKATIFRDGKEVSSKLFSPWHVGQPTEKHFRQAHEWAQKRVSLLQEWEVLP